MIKEAIARFFSVSVIFREPVDIKCAAYMPVDRSDIAVYNAVERSDITCFSQVDRSDIPAFMPVSECL